MLVLQLKQNGKNTLDANGNPLTKTEKVTPKDTVNFKNGNGTTVKAVTKKGATPTASDETSISVDVDGIKFTDKMVTMLFVMIMVIT